LVLVSTAGGFDLPDLLFGQIGVAVLDQPEKESFEKDDVIVNGVLLERPATLAGGGLDRGYSFEDLGDGAVAVGRHVTSPADKQVDNLILPGLGDPLGCLDLDEKLVHEFGIVRDETLFFNGTLDGVVGILRLDQVKLPVLCCRCG
jgi:hypothetical protein